MKLSTRIVSGALGGLLPLLLASCTVGPCGITWVWSGSGSVPDSPPASESLSPEQYDAAEVVYRNFLPGGQWPESGTNSEYCLAFGHRNSTVPADFISRFATFAPRVFTGTNGLLLGPGIRKDPASGRDVVMLTIDSLSLHERAAEARVFYIGPSTVATEKLQLARPNDAWRVTKRKEETRSYF